MGLQMFFWAVASGSSSIEEPPVRMLWYRLERHSKISDYLDLGNGDVFVLLGRRVLHGKTGIQDGMTRPLRFSLFRDRIVE